MTGTGTDTVWLAPGVGPIRRLSTGTFDGVGFVSDEELNAYFVDGIANNLDPATTDLVTGNLEAGTSRSWYFVNPPANRSTVALTGLTGRARLEVGSCRTEGGGPGPDNSFIQCTVAPSQGPLVVQVQGIEATSFALSLGANPLVSAPVSESKNVSLGIPTPGQVATRGESWYSTSVTLGTYGVYVLGASGDVNLHVYGSGYPMELDCTRWAPYTYPARWSCVLPMAEGVLNFSVESGPVNREGASYLLLVHPMP